MVDLGWKPELNWPTDGELLERSVKKAFNGVQPRWMCVRDDLAVGSSVAHALCRRFGLDPDEIVKRKR